MRLFVVMLVVVVTFLSLMVTSFNKAFVVLLMFLRFSIRGFLVVPSVVGAVMVFWSGEGVNRKLGECVKDTFSIFIRVKKRLKFFLCNRFLKA